MVRFWMTALALLLSSEVAVGKVNLVLEDQPISVRTPIYAARVEPDGCLTHLAPGGINFLAPGVSLSRGSYFYKDGPLRLQDLERVDDCTVCASSDVAAVRYEFEDESVTMQLTNKSDQDLVFFVVLNGLVNAISLDGGDLQDAPINGERSQATFFAGTQRLEIEGFDKVWGPWQGPHQVVQTSLKPKETKALTFRASTATESERVQIIKLKAMPAESDLTITSPRDYQVIQRLTEDSGRVLVSGRTRPDATSLEIRVAGEGLPGNQQSWRAIQLQPESHKFSSWITLPAGGWYRLEARSFVQDELLAVSKVEKFGVGEVFVGAGQSNSTNSGQFKTKQTTGMVSSFSGTHWQLADDPQPGVADRTQGGSFWPAFGDRMYQQLGVPIGVATTGYGGTSVNQWQPDGDLFQRWLLARVHQLGPQGFRAVLWHQGESDVTMPPEEYYTKLKSTILSATDQAGWEFPWFVAIASYHSAENPSFESVRSAQKRLCDEGIALLGPDTDVLTGDHRDLDGKGIHFSPKGLKAHGTMWAVKVLPYVERAADNSTRDAGTAVSGE